MGYEEREWACGMGNGEWGMKNEGIEHGKREWGMENGE